MRSRLPFAALCLLWLGCFWACEPDLNSLTAGYSAGSPSTGGSGGTGGDTGTGGDAATGGSSASGGTGGTSGTGGDAGAGNEAGQSGAPGGPSVCDNLARDPNESDVDCGGSSECKRCGNNLRCSNNKDCASAFCKKGRCAEPTCADGYQNQDETGTDCGGSCAPDLGCDNDEGCLVNEDCTSQFCKNKLCVSHCSSGKRDADEADKDCGGAECGPCPDESDCQRAADCQSKICFNNVCQVPTCDDRVQNQDESDKDCGGSCKACPVTKHCNAPTDCDTFICDNEECTPDIIVPTADFIDNFEDGDMSIIAQEGRVGGWYAYGDGTGQSTFVMESIPGGRGPDSKRGLHTTGSGFMMWGSGAGADMKNSGGQQQTKAPYDASAYSGVTFWARAAGPLSVAVVFPDKDTDLSIGNCTNTDEVKGCDHHWLTFVQVDAVWRRYTVHFADLQLEPGGDPIPTAFAADGLVSVQFRFSAGTTYDLWIDDVAFVAE